MISADSFALANHPFTHLSFRAHPGFHRRMIARVAGVCICEKVAPPTIVEQIFRRKRDRP